MKNNEKIAIFLPSFLGGGVEKMMVYLANNFSERGFTVDYVVIKNYGPYKELLSEKVNLIDLNKKRVITSIFALASYLRKNKPDVLLTAMNYVSIVAYIANKLSLTNTKLVVSERAIPSKRLERNLKALVFKKTLSHVYSKSSQVIAISNDVKTDLINNFKVKSQGITVVHNMVDLNNIRLINNDKKLQLYNKYFNQDENIPPIIIAAGRLVEYKNFSYLIDAFYLLSKSNLKVKLIILGEGGERARLEKQIETYNLENRIKLPGFVTNPNDFYQISSLFVSTSKHEGFGNVIAEAMALGLPIIVSDCKGGPKEIVGYGKYGDIVPLNDVNLLALKITTKITEKYDASISVNRSKDFGVDKISQQYLQVLLDE
jgi:glycosyltransferase involved in cell wall biosynthesis